MVAGDEFSELLGRLKERSGLSYGVLGKRLHTSTSTLHRYVNGDAVPTDYAPVERFARVCKATPEELVELHRRWVIADARRGQKAGGAEPGTADGAATADGGTVEAVAVAEPEPEPEPETETETRIEAAEGVAGRRRAVALAGVAVVASLMSAALALHLVSGGSEDDQGRKQSLGAAAPPSADAAPAASGSASGSASAKDMSASPSASRGGGPTASATAAASGSGGAEDGEDGEDGATAPTVAVNPYKWENQCSQHYLIDRNPEQVPPPPSEPDARGWVTALGGVPAGQQMLALTVQGTGKATVVLDALHVRVVEKSAPLAWNDFTMGVGCGGGVRTAAFGTDLDAGRPALSPKAGQHDFPYKVSESDPEVFYVFADARAHNVSWYLELDWSSGDRQGTLRIDDHGKPFRTAGNVGRPAYTYPLGDSEWGRDPYEPDIPG
ncbi:helix-turn-helix transcriptional regulator [Streptomyces sp. NPDC005811]|uniref:helix-turn-helix domain-containing protein n=1 Tax=Streptomyces sp. NPDC005811 TaxID=3154565 RepID=UPI0033F29A8A